MKCIEAMAPDAGTVAFGLKSKRAFALEAEDKRVE
jgi:hypothetical protein